MRRRDRETGRDLARATCPTCKEPGALTPYEAVHGYQCRTCTRRAEGYGFEAQA